MLLAIPCVMEIMIAKITATRQLGAKVNSIKALVINSTKGNLITKFSKDSA